MRELTQDTSGDAQETCSRALRAVGKEASAVVDASGDVQEGRGCACNDKVPRACELSHDAAGPWFWSSKSWGNEAQQGRVILGGIEGFRFTRQAFPAARHYTRIGVIKGGEARGGGYDVGWGSRALLFSIVRYIVREWL